MVLPAALERNRSGIEGSLDRFYFKLIVPEGTELHNEFIDLVPQNFSLPKQIKEKHYVNTNLKTDTKSWHKPNLVFDLDSFAIDSSGKSYKLKEFNPKYKLYRLFFPNKEENKKAKLTFAKDIGNNNVVYLRVGISFLSIKNKSFKQLTALEEQLLERISDFSWSLSKVRNPKGCAFNCMIRPKENAINTITVFSDRIAEK
jgi:hypothetical protein